MKNDQLSVLYTGAFRFPDRDAAAFRVYSIAQLLTTQGHNVSFAGWENESAPYRYQGHECFPQNEFRERDVNIVSRLLGFLTRGKRTLRWLVQNDRYDLVIAYNPPVFFAIALLILGRIRRFRVALDTTEWYESTHLPGGKYGPAAIENWLRMHVAYPLFKNVIAISKFLEEKFTGRNVVLIRPIVEPQCTRTESPPMDSVIRVLYAGDAGRKDKLLPFIGAMASIEKRLSRRLELHIAGITSATLDRILVDNDMILEKRDAIVCYGRVPRTKVFELYETCHFSILFREDARYAWAGFPTKATESWSSGRPIITNAVGDLSSIAHHLRNAVIVSEPNLAEDLILAFNKILDGGLYPSMVDSSLKTAQEYFSLKAFVKPMLAFIQKL